MRLYSAELGFDNWKYWVEEILHPGWLKPYGKMDKIGCLPPFSTGAGFRNHPQYAVHEYSLYMQCTHAVHDFGRF